MAISMVLEQDGGSDYVGHTGSDLLCLFKAFGIRFKFDFLVTLSSFTSAQRVLSYNLTYGTWFNSFGGFEIQSCGG